MRLWLLRPIDVSLSPWHPWIESCVFGFVVRAKDEAGARVRASLEAGDEGPKAWLSGQYSTCVELTTNGPGEIIIRDFNPPG